LVVLELPQLLLLAREKTEFDGSYGGLGAV
jgi:hypothetical protein